MESFKKNVEGVWVHVKGHDVDVERFMKYAGQSKEEIEFFVPSEPKIEFHVQSNGDIAGVSYPYRNNPDIVENLTFKLGKDLKVPFQDPMMHKKTLIESYMEGGDTFVQILRPVEQPGVKKCKMTYITKGNELEVLTEIYESDDEQGQTEQTSQKIKMSRKFTKEV